MIRRNRISSERAVTLCVVLLIGLAMSVAAVQAASHEINIIKVDPEGEVLENITVDHQYMKDNLPQAGDGRTHYYHQGPVVFGWERVHPDEPLDIWDPEETVNYQTKDMGAVKGTDINDLCELVGGLGSGDEVEISASDGFSKKFSSENVRNPEPRQGPLVIDWASWRLVFLADTSSNPDGLHVFGTYDMHECLDEKYWHYYYKSDDKTYNPATTGLSVQNVGIITIYSGGSGDAGESHSSGDGGNERVPERGSLNITSTPANATVIIDGEVTEYQTNTTITDVPFGDYGITVYKDGYQEPTETWVTVRSTAVTKKAFELERSRGGIKASSIPEGAYIHIDGLNTSVRTDGTLSDLVTGGHTVSLHLSGYLPQSEEVLVREGTESPVEMVLTPACRDENPDSLSFVESGSLNGDVRYIYHSAYTGLISGGKTLRFSLPVEASGKIRTARLSVYTDCGQDIMTRNWSEPQAGVSLSDLLTPTAVWQAKGPHGMGSSTQAYDISGALNGTETYILDVENTGDEEHVFSVAGLGLLMVTEDPAGPDRDYILYEGCSGEACHLDLQITPEMATDMKNAELVVASTGEGNISAEINGNALTGVQASEPPLNIIKFPAEAFLSEDENTLNITGGQVRTVLLTINHIKLVKETETHDRGFIAWLLSVFGILPDEDKANHVKGEETLAESQIISGNVEETTEISTPTPETGRPESKSVQTGGVYVVSVPGEAAIYLDGKPTDFRSPHLIYGLKEGLHTVKLRMGDDVERYSEQKIWISPDTISQADFDLNIDDQKVSVNLNSTDYAGQTFTLNGAYPTHIFPASLNTESFGAYITIMKDGIYESRSLGAVEDGSTLIIEPIDKRYGVLTVRSKPEGSAVNIDGYDTGRFTPSTIRGISEGPHLITVSKAGYIPSRRLINMVDTRKDEDMSLDLSPEPYNYGSLNLTSTPEGADIYLYNRYSGKKTPYTFGYMPIGTYNVGLSYNGSVTERLDVTVLPMQVGHGHKTF